MDQDAHLWRTPEVMADAAVLAEFAEDILRRPWPGVIDTKGPSRVEFTRVPGTAHCGRR